MADDTEQNKKFIFDWEIVNFNFNTIGNGKYVRSPVFEPKAFLSTSWYLEFYPKKTGDSDYLSCYLYRTQAGAKKIYITFKIEFIVSGGKIFSSYECRQSEFARGDNLGWMDIFKGSDDLNKMTIRCTMILLHSHRVISKCKAVTKFGIDRYSFLWYVKFIDDSSWTKRKIFPCSQNNVEVTLTTPRNCFNITVKKMKNESYVMECKLSLLDINQVEQDSGKYSHSFNSDDKTDTWEFLSFIMKDKLLNEKTKFIKEEFFTLKLEFFISNGNICEEIEPVIIDVSSEVENEIIKVHSISQSDLQLADTRHLQTDNNLGTDSSTKKDTLSALQDDLKRMFIRSLHTDINLHTESQVFQVHKSLLSARSPVFAAMFEQDMLENQTGIVDIPDVEDKILDCFLKFVYTGIEDSMDYECASKLIIVADKYQVQTLKDECSSFLMSNLTTENATDIVVLADMIGHESLKTHTIDFIQSHAETILPTDHWARCVQANIKLATDIIFKLSVKYSGK